MPRINMYIQNTLHRKMKEYKVKKNKRSLEEVLNELVSKGLKK